MLTKVGTGTLTLSGANTHTGLTTVDEGTLVINGSIAAGAVVKDGGILKGIGSMGTVVVEAGGVFSPGLSPGTITVGGLTSDERRDARTSNSAPRAIISS